MARFSRSNGSLGNELLGRLAVADLKMLMRELEPVTLTARHVISQTDDPIDHVYFPVSAVLTLHIGDNPRERHDIEVATVGKEGMTGYPALLGVPNSFHRIVCHATGECLRTPASALAKAMRQRPAVDALFRRYLAVALRGLSQAVLCNAFHAVEQRFCRWLLVAQDKSPGEFPATQELLAANLGVKRPTISLVAQALQKQGVISYHRGTVRILDPLKLEQHACPCFRVTKRHYHEILGS